MASWEIPYLVIVVLDFTILKNDGVKVNGFRMTSHINEMEK